MNVELKAYNIYKILSNKRYNRDEPHLDYKLKNIFIYFINLNKPIRLVGFWGVGPKTKHNWADLASCEFLKKLDDDVKKIYPPGIEFIFIFATLHGIHNGIKIDSIRSYIKDIKKIFNIFNFKYIYLDNLWKKYGISFEKIDTIFKNKPKGWWNKIGNASLIEKNARNRNLRLDSRTAAQKYYIMRDLEKEMLKEEFSQCIFHAFSDSKLRNVLPNLPTLYFYSRQGWSDTPWFVTKEKDK